MINLKKNILKYFILFLAPFLQAQEDSSWISMLSSTNSNLYDLQAKFNLHFKNKDINEKGNGYKIFKRLENHYEQRVYPSGDMGLLSQSYPNFEAWKTEKAKRLFYRPNVSSASSDPTAAAAPPTLSPANWTTVSIAKAGLNGYGRLTAVRFHPTEPNTIFICTGNGGLWKTTDLGLSWASKTDQLSVIGCSDFAIHPTNTNIQYLLSGDSEGDIPSIGVFKSIDGGNTWNTTGLTNNRSLSRQSYKLLIDKRNPDILMASTSAGLFRTTDAGVSWIRTTSSGVKFTDVERLGNSDTLIGGFRNVYRSIDNGITWTQITGVLPSAGISRLAIATQASNSSIVYILYGQSSDEGCLGVYLSVNGGTTFKRMKDNSAPFIMGYSNPINVSNGQAFYDITIAVSPTNAAVVTVGGIDIWQSLDSGRNWAIKSLDPINGTVHADQHDLIYSPHNSNQLFSGNDGGLDMSPDNGTQWINKNSPSLSIAQQYRIGSSNLTDDYLIAGHQDNGTNIYKNSAWSNVFGGDGLDAFIDKTDDNRLFISYTSGSQYISKDGGATNTQVALPAGDWLCPWKQNPHPLFTNNIYASGRVDTMYISKNFGANFSALGVPYGNVGNSVGEFAVSIKNPLVLYALKSNYISKSTDGGITWANVSGTLPTSSTKTYIAISDYNENIVWVTYSGYNASNKVFKTIDGGATWVNMSNGLPNVPVNVIVAQQGYNDPIYIGTDVGVFYTDNDKYSTSVWDNFSDNLPITTVRDLEIYYPTNKLYAGTYGRGTWQTPLRRSSELYTIANFSNPAVACANTNVSFKNSSINTDAATTYYWTFPGGTPNTSTEKNPRILYSTTGLYKVSLRVSNAYNTDSLIQLEAITIVPNNPVVPGVISINLPLKEMFTTTATPLNWEMYNPTTSSDIWKLRFLAYDTVIAHENRFSHNNTQLRTPYLNLSNFATAKLVFKVSNSARQPSGALAAFDTLRVFAVNNCSGKQDTIYQKIGSALLTNLAPSQPVNANPIASNWRVESCDISSYTGNDAVSFRFQNAGARFSGFGNTIFLDSISITGIENPAASVVPSINIATSATNVCSGTSVTFTATPTNGGSAPSYQWKLNGANVGTNNATYSNNALANADVITCVLTSNASGASPSTATSNAINMTITSSVVPSVSIIASATSISTGTSVTLTATHSNGGTAPTYQWKLNGANVGTNASTYTSNAFANGDVITCVLTSNASCASTSIATSNSITITITSVIVPSISIATSSTNVCSGTSVTFTATPTNGGSAPSYQWKLNGANVGTNNATYSNNALANADVITCVLTSNASGASPLTATSNAINMVISSSASIVPVFSYTNNFTSTYTNTAGSSDMPINNWGTCSMPVFSLSGNPVGTSINASTGIVSWNNSVIVGFYYFTISATNSSGTGTTNYNLIIRQNNNIDGFKKRRAHKN